MTLELTPKTEPGRRLVTLAETLAEDLRPAAAAHDRRGTFAHESLAALQESGFLGAPIPEHLGGLGVLSIHDLVVASSRLSRADAALAIGANMHLAFVISLVRRWRQADAEGNARRVAAFAASLEQVTCGHLVYAAAISEPAQDLTRPSTTATRSDDGWTISGRKVFCTMSPGADVLYVSVTFADDAHGETFGYALVPTDAAGLLVHDDWDALGMRASGSNSVTLDAVRVPRDALRGGFPVGSTAGYVERNLDAGLLHAAAALGVAEDANAHATGRIAAARRDAHTDGLAAENAVDLSACRGILSRAASLLDEHFAPDWTVDPLLLFAETQAAKTFIGEAAVRVVDRALALSGGAGYLSDSTLARAYRDVRATAFMHPLGANRAYSYLADVALGGTPTVH